MAEFPLPDETDNDKLRETFLYMTMRAIMIRNLLEAGVDIEDIRTMISVQDQIWESLDGQVADGWDD